MRADGQDDGGRDRWDDGLDEQQEAVARHGRAPLVVVAGAGTGKTRALTARVAALVEAGTPISRVLLLTFTRRAADDMLARAASSLRPATPHDRPWGGTFHSVAARIVGAHAPLLGLSGTSVLDPADAAVTMELLMDEHGLTGTDVRLPRPATLVDAYSRAVNTGTPLREVIDLHFPWCAPHADVLRELMRAYVARKRERGQLDFDDLLLMFRALLCDESLGPAIRSLWDYVLVDEYQDVNRLQVDIVRALRPDGAGLTVVGDDAQAIYGFRGCDPGHLAELQRDFPDARLVRLEHNYRSRPRVVTLANAVRPLGEAARLTLRPVRSGTGRCHLVRSYDAAEEARAVCDAVLAAAADGVRLRDQAVLMRTGHHSDLLEVELTARRVPFRKYGGLRFLEAAHVRDLLAALRLVSNPRDDVAWFRILRLHDGIGAGHARSLLPRLVGDDCADADVVAAGPARSRLTLEATLHGLTAARGLAGAPAQAHAALRLLRPLVERRYDDATVRLADLVRLVDAAGAAEDLPELVAQLTLDPPASTGAPAGPPHLDEDYLVLSTVHSAKGLEWSRVHVIGLADGAFPSDMALRTRDGLAEEQRLFYVAVTRARDEVHLHAPLRLPHHRRAADDRHSFAAASRFLTDAVQHCESVERAPRRATATAAAAGHTLRVAPPSLDDLWA